MAGDDDWRTKYRDTTYGPEFTCKGAEYYEPLVTVKCYYWTHVNHWDYFVEIPPAGLSFSRHGGRRWADYLIDTLYDIQGRDTNTHSLDWWEMDETNNWGHSVMVHFKTGKNGKGEHDRRSEVRRSGLRFAISLPAGLPRAPSRRAVAFIGASARCGTILVRKVSVLERIFQRNASKRGRMGSKTISKSSTQSVRSWCKGKIMENDGGRRSKK